jgi:hypothetical protein
VEIVEDEEVGEFGEESHAAVVEDVLVFGLLDYVAYVDCYQQNEFLPEDIFFDLFL